MAVPLASAAVGVGRAGRVYVNVGVLHAWFGTMVPLLADQPVQPLPAPDPRFLEGGAESKVPPVVGANENEARTGCRRPAGASPPELTTIGLTTTGLRLAGTGPTGQAPSLAHCRWRVQTVVKGIWRRVTEAGGKPASVLMRSKR
jgi:hypothetical protein